MKITTEFLEERRACLPDVHIFDDEWPEGCEVTEENCKRAFNELRLSIKWAYARLIRIDVQLEFRKEVAEITDEFERSTTGLRPDIDEEDWAKFKEASKKLQNDEIKIFVKAWKRQEELEKGGQR